MAAGGAVDPFWDMYQQHLEEGPLEILESMRIGNLDTSKDVVVEKKEVVDLYANEPWESRHPSLVVRSQKPYNAEPPATKLVDSFLTPTEFFYIRNHLPVPVIDAKEYAFQVLREVAHVSPAAEGGQAEVREREMDGDLICYPRLPVHFYHI